MIIKTPLRIVVMTVLLITSGGTTLAQELLPTARSANAPSVSGSSSTRGVTLELQLDRTGIVAVGGQQIISANNACVCTNLSYASIICPDCDREVDYRLCHTHDRACKDAAQRGGIREHNTFYCVENEQ